MSEAAPRKLSFGTKVAYGFGSVAYGVKDQGFQALLLIYYNQVLGLPAIMVSTALLIALLIDAFIDPIIGQVSDNWRSKWGRRHPFMYFAAIPIAISFYFLWNPPELSQEAMFIYLIVIAVLVRAFLSMYEIPSSSLLPELTSDYDQRTALISYRYFFGVTGGLLMTIAVFQVFLRPDIDHPVGQLNPAGYHTYSIAAAAVIVISIILSALGTHRLISTFRAPEERKVSVLQTLREMLHTLSNRSIIVLRGSGIFSGMAVGLAGALGLYFGTYYWGLSASQFALLSVASFAGTIISVIISTPLTRAFGKKVTALSMFIIAVLVLISPVLLRQAGLFPENGSPLLLPLLMAERGFVSMCGTVAAILGASMVADTVEDAELRTGRRSEGLIVSANTFVNKAVSGVGLFAAGLVLSLVEFPENAQPGLVTDGVLSHLAIVYSIAIILLFSGSIACLFGYRVSRQSHAESLQRLQAGSATPAE